MSLTFTQRHDDLMCILGVSLVIGLGILGMVAFFEWNDQQWFETLDKLTCAEIWEYMIEQGGDWDTLDYYGDRC